MMIYMAKTRAAIVGSVFVLEFAVKFAKSTISTVGGLLPVHVTGGGHAPVLRQAGHSAPLVHAVLWVRSHLPQLGISTKHIPAPAPLIELLFNCLP